MKHKILVYFLSFFGIALSAYQFLINRSLWLDEAKIGQNIIEKSYLELLQPLHSNQVAPILFLWLEKASVDLIKHEEFALRIVPLLAYITAIFLVYRVALLITKNKTIAVVVLSLFCVSPWLIYYASEVKQYSVDVMVTLLLYYAFLKPYTSLRRKHITLSLLGIICLFLSNISIIILFSIGLYALIFEIKKDKKWFLTGLSWVLAFTFYYLTFIHNHPTRTAMNTFWEYAFIPKNPFSTEFWLWVYDTLKMIFLKCLRFQSRFGIYWMIAGLYFLGLIHIVRQKKHKVLVLVLSPIIVHLALSYLKLYPFDLRVILYQIPLYLFGIATGIVLLKDVLVKKTKRQWFIIILCIPFLLSARNLLKIYPYEREEVKPVFDYVMQHNEPENTIYVYNSHTDAFLFYSKIGYLKLDSPNIVYGKFFRKDYTLHNAQLNTLSGKVWFLISHEYIDLNNKLSEADYIIDYAKSRGQLLKETHAKNSSAYLIELK